VLVIPGSDKGDQVVFYERAALDDRHELCLILQDADIGQWITIDNQ
jgi:hypothetical protein